MYQQEESKKHLNIKEASVRYNVSRAKLNSLISLGHLHAEPDPRDGRARLISSQELEELFGLTGGDTMYKSTYTTGRPDNLGKRTPGRPAQARRHDGQESHEQRRDRQANEGRAFRLALRLATTDQPP